MALFFRYLAIRSDGGHVPLVDQRAASNRCRRLRWLGHAVVALQHETLGAVFAEVALLVLAEDEERIEDVFGFVTV